MKRLKLFLLPLLAVIAILLISTNCTHNLAGATTETTNGVVGVVHNSDNTPSANTVVKLFPDDYDPVADAGLDDGFIDTTNTKGSYQFKKVSSGRYVVIARNRSDSTSCLIRDITVTDDSLTTAPVEKLKGSGSIATDFSSGGVISNGYLYIPGTDIYSRIGTDGSVLLDDVPAGTIREIILASDNNKKSNILRSAITVDVGKTTMIELPLWKYGRKLTLKTTSAGADVPGDVYNFPVLIRLNGSNFDFSQARADGTDLVFTGKSNAVLPREIERWDAAAKRAEIWVKVDTIRGNDSSQSITMYWGNQAASQISTGAIFDTGDGFQGVWHLGEASDGATRDATINKYDGTSPDSASPQVAEGIIGNCRVFDGVKDYITMPNTAEGKLNLPENGNYTISAWVLLDTLDGMSHCIVSKGYEQYYLRSTYASEKILLSSPLWEFVEFGENVKWQTTTCPASNKQWALVVGVRQGNRQFIYCNGELVDSTIFEWPNAVSRNTSNDLYIGKFSKAVTVPVSEGFCFFNGSIDEVRIINTAQSPDWVRLCYMNQRPDNRLVIFR